MTNPEIPPIEVVKDPPFPWGRDTLANHEEKSFDDENALKAQKTKNDLTWLKVYGLITVFIAIFLTLLFVVMIVVLSVHYMGHKDWAWLDAERLSKIQTIVFSSTLGSIVSSVITKQISKS